jgi:hypothetical protein
MSPGFSLYLQYVCYYLFVKHKPIVNMAGDPSKIENEEDKRESEKRINDTLLVKYFSIYYMNESRKLINSMVDYCQKLIIHYFLFMECIIILSIKKDVI